MAIRLGDVAPDFTAETTEGTIHFYDWLGDSWGILFSHPKDFTPVCTTELGAFAARKGDFDKRNTKIIGVSVDDVASHDKWKADIQETQGSALNFPLIGDQDRKVADLYDMIHPNANDTLTVRSSVATPVNWKDGGDVIIVNSVTDEEAKTKFPKGFKKLKDYLRVTPQPNK